LTGWQCRATIADIKDGEPKMDNNQGSTVPLVVETQLEPVSFLDDKIDLKKLARDISKATSKAVEVLLELLDSKDERVKLQAATKLVEFHVQVQKEISSDQLQRLIAEIKVAQSSRKLVDANNPDKQRPVVDFSTIRKIG
jgi:HEAT repeat protein